MDANNLISKIEQEAQKLEDQSSSFKIYSASDIIKNNPDLREPIVDGIIRAGEICNINAAPKTGKTIFSLQLANAVATGNSFLGFKTTQGKVLILDNELHPESISYRLKTMCKDSASVQNVDFGILRGTETNIDDFDDRFKDIPKGKYKLVIIDAFYRIFTEGGNENDNVFMTQMYNKLDSLAKKQNCAIIVVHHTSKGNQSMKSVTDIGAGAGAQSRAADTHLAIIPHNENGAYVIKAVCRSFNSPESFCVRRIGFNFELADDLDPNEEFAIRKTNPTPKKPKPTPQEFTDLFITKKPKLRNTIIVEAEQAEISKSHSHRMLEYGESEGLIFRHLIGDSKKAGFATVRPSSDDDIEESK